jgi:hypothetical protein
MCMCVFLVHLSYGGEHMEIFGLDSITEWRIQAIGEYILNLQNDTRGILQSVKICTPK